MDIDDIDISICSAKCTLSEYALNSYIAYFSTHFTMLSHIRLHVAHQMFQH